MGAVKKTAVVVGVTGQDGAYLTDLLLAKGYKVFGAYRHNGSVDFWRLKYLGLLERPGLELLEHDLADLPSTLRLIGQTQPDEVYNLAAQSFVGVSLDQPSLITSQGPVNLLEAIRLVRPGARFFQASSSEMFGKAQTAPQTEDTPFHPRNPYGVDKLYAHWTTVNYRENYGLFAVSGILFNHESPLRGLEFVTRKITDAVAQLKLGRTAPMEIGNLSAQRDWGYAKEYVEGMRRMLQMDEPDTYVLATGRAGTVRDFTTLAFRAAGMEIAWRGQGETEEGFDPRNGRKLVRVNREFYRPAEATPIIGDPGKAREKLGWEAGVSLERLCRIMLEADLARRSA